MSDSEIPPETIASIQHELGEKERNSVKKLVRVETKPEKWEDRILVLSICRAFIFSVSTKSSVKLEHGYHYLDIQSIESRNLLQLKIGTTGGMFCYRLTTKGDADEIITHIGASLKKIFPNRQFEKLVITVNLEPIERKEKILTTLDSLEMEDLGPCGGFSSMYMCMCDYHHLPYREEITWDVDTIYLSQSSKHMCLNDFDHLDGRDLIPVVAALEHNDWFNKISVQDIKLHPDVTKQLIKVLKKNGNIQELVLENTGILKGEELGKKLASAMHGPCKLLVLNLSGNHVDDVGVIHLSGVLRTQAEGLVELNLSNTKMTAKGRAASNLGASLQSGKIKSTLKKLNLSENSFKGEEFLQMLNFLAQPNVLSNLYLSNCDLALDTLFTSFSNGCTHTLQHLDVSKNVFTTKKAKEILVPQSIKKYFANSTALKSCNLSSNKLPPEALKEILLGIASNKVIRELKLDLSCNELKYEGADIIEGCIGNIAAIGSLDISENGFDVRTGQLIDWIRQNKFIKHLFVGGNLHSVRQHRRQLGKVLDTIVTLLQEDDSVLESLSLADSKLKADTATVLDAVGSNTQLTYLDISTLYELYLTLVAATANATAATPTANAAAVTSAASTTIPAAAAPTANATVATAAASTTTPAAATPTANATAATPTANATAATAAASTPIPVAATPTANTVATAAASTTIPVAATPTANATVATAAAASTTIPAAATPTANATAAIAAAIAAASTTIPVAATPTANTAATAAASTPIPVAATPANTTVATAAASTTTIPVAATPTANTVATAAASTTIPVAATPTANTAATAAASTPIPVTAASTTIPVAATPTANATVATAAASTTIPAAATPTANATAAIAAASTPIPVAATPTANTAATAAASTTIPAAATPTANTVATAAASTTIPAAATPTASATATTSAAFTTIHVAATPTANATAATADASTTIPAAATPTANTAATAAASTTIPAAANATVATAAASNTIPAAATFTANTVATAAASTTTPAAATPTANATATTSAAFTTIPVAATPTANATAVGTADASTTTPAATTPTANATATTSAAFTTIPLAATPTANAAATAAASTTTTAAATPTANATATISAAFTTIPVAATPTANATAATADASTTIPAAAVATVVATACAATSTAAAAFFAVVVVVIV
uniref:Uncharacterized protein LOC102804835 n=1 Tax=Saccoglossus kowalevskii TaxID=10224 RepID=A0ABM0LV18_SACKO|nr:PREDICTED: uncharacterized protein LOC102804835 [Saccoglossus kowalevskii]